MITTKITVEPHLAQYCYAKYSSDPEGSMPVRFADHLEQTAPAPLPAPLDEEDMERFGQLASEVREAAL